MSQKLTQKWFFTSRETEIMETKVIYTYSLFGKETQLTVNYEDLSKNKEAYILNRPNFYIPPAVLALFTFASFMWRDDKDFNPYYWIFWGITFIVSLVIYIISIEKLWRIRIHINFYIYFFRKIPNQEIVDDFIASLFRARDLYLRETYFFEPNKNMAYETQKNNLQWLRRNEVINKSEFEDSKNKLDKVFKIESSKIGFN